jgi:hypothetical protein
MVAVEEIVAKLVGDAPGGPAAPYLVLRGPRGPRWLIPERPSPALLIVLTGWRPYDRLPAAKWSLFRRLYRLGLAGRLPGVERRYLWLGVPSPAVYLGTPDRRQKALAFVPGADGLAPERVQKTALGPDAAAAVAHEAETLLWLATHRPNLAPRLLRHDPATATLTMAWCPGRLVPRALDPRLLDTLAALALGRAVTVGDEDLAPWPPIERLVRATPLPERVPGCVEHGDMAPWNIRRDDGTLRLTDWEDARIEGLPLQDLFSYALAVGHRLERQPVAAALFSVRAPAFALAARIGPDRELFPGLVARFLARRVRQAAERGDAALVAALLAAAEDPGLVAAWA